MRVLLSVVAVLLVALTLSACTSTQRAAGVGAVAGGVIGAATSGTLQGAAVGAAVGTVAGAVAGTMLGRWEEDSDKCVYEDRRGRRFIDDCPEG
jgi:uncharacterized protein YcfJ